MATKRIHQAKAVANVDFLGIVEAAIMIAAYGVLADKDHPDYDQRSSLSRTLFHADTPPSQRSGIIRLFAWFAVNDTNVQDESYASGTFDPYKIQDESIDSAIVQFWDTAAMVVEETVA